LQEVASDTVNLRLVSRTRFLSLCHTYSAGPCTATVTSMHIALVTENTVMRPSYIQYDPTFLKVNGPNICILLLTGKPVITSISSRQCS